MNFWTRGFSLGAALLFPLWVWAQGQEALIRKNLSDRIPQLPKIEEISRTPMNGLFEVRLQTNELYYTDAEGNFLITGQLIETRTRRNLTEERENKLNAIDFSTLPLKDAITLVRGQGRRKLAVFEDPNCGFCRRFERDLPRWMTSRCTCFSTRCSGPTRWKNPKPFGAPRTPLPRGWPS